MIFQNRGQFGGQVPRIGVLLGTSRGSHVKMARFWKIVSLESNETQNFVFWVSYVKRNFFQSLILTFGELEAFASTRLSRFFAFHHTGIAR